VIRFTEETELSLKQAFQVWHVDGKWAGVEAARHLFFAQLNAHAPQALWYELDQFTDEVDAIREELRREDYNMRDLKRWRRQMNAIFKLQKSGIRVPDHWSNREMLPKEFHNRALTEFLKTYRVWLNRWNLNSEWLFQHFATTLDMWTRFSGERGKPVSQILFDRLENWKIIEPIAPPVLFNYDPRQTDWKMYMSQVEQLLEPYRKTVEEKFEAHGYRPTARNWTLEHFEWIVRYQVCKESYAQISRTARKQDGRSYSRNAVREAIRDVADMIDLHLRNARA
jgi:hypothetical protein